MVMRSKSSRWTAPEFGDKVLWSDCAADNTCSDEETGIRVLNEKTHQDDRVGLV